MVPRHYSWKSSGHSSLGGEWDAGNLFPAAQKEADFGPRLWCQGDEASAERPESGRGAWEMLVSWETESERTGWRSIGVIDSWWIWLHCRVPKLSAGLNEATQVWVLQCRWLRPWWKLSPPGGRMGLFKCEGVPHLRSRPAASWVSSFLSYSYNRPRRLLSPTGRVCCPAVYLWAFVSEGWFVCINHQGERT